MTRLADYVRQSSRRESGSEASPATQTEAINRRSLDYPDRVWVGRFADIGISGYKEDVERPDYDKLCALVASGGVDVVIVHYMSRLTRQDVKTSLPLLMGWLASGVVIVSCNEGTFRYDNIGDLISLIINLDRGHRESDNKSKAIKAAKALALSHGGYIGKPPYGFTLVLDMVVTSEGRPLAIRRLVPDQQEADTVRRIVREASEGVPLGRVAADLNRAGVPTRGQVIGKHTSTSAWSTRTLSRIIRDPRIAGLAATIEYGVTPEGRKTTKAASYHIERDDAGRAVEAHTGIVTPDEWWALQAVLDNLVAPPPGSPPRTSLLAAANILFCHCGARMKSHRNSETGYRSVYLCTRTRGVTPAPGTHSGACTVSQKALDAYVAGRIFALIGGWDEDSPDYVTDIMIEVSRRFAARNADPDSAGKRAALVGDLANAEANLDDHLAARRMWRNRLPEWERRADALNAAVDALTAAIAAHDADASPKLLDIDAWTGGDAGPMGEGSWWSRADINARRSFVSLFVERITIGKGNRPRPGKARPVVDHERVLITFVGGPS